MANSTVYSIMNIMPNDIITLTLLCHELNSDLVNGKIQSVFLSKEKYIYLEILTKGKKIVYLVFSAKRQNTIIFLTKKKSQKSEDNANIVQILKKYITGSKIKSIELSSNDRIITIQTIQNNELYEEKLLNIIFEISPQKPNIILVNWQGIILGSLEILINEKRSITPGDMYIYPKVSLSRNKDSLINLFGKVTMREYDYLLNTNGKETTINLFRDFLNLKKLSYKPCVIFKDTSPLGYFLYPYESITSKNDNVKVEYCSTLSESIELFTNNIESLDNFTTFHPNEKKFVEKALKSYLIRLDTIEQNISQIPILDNLLNDAELLKCNLHLVIKGSEFIDCWDFSQNKTVRIILNPLISPSQNLEQKFKKYNKLKATINYSIKNKELIESSISHLQSISFLLTLSNDKTDISAIIKELSDHFNYKIKEEIKNTIIKKSIDNYIQFFQDGFKVLIGKNNLQNDNITFRIANKDDLWLHVNGAPGSHTIIKNAGKNIPISTISSVACYSAYYSSQRNNNKVMVDYANVKNLKKGTSPGSVIVKAKNSIIVSPASPNLNSSD